MYENYIGCLSTEADTMVNMTETGILPACAKDLQKINTASDKFTAPRKAAYESIVDESFAFSDLQWFLLVLQCSLWG